MSLISAIHPHYAWPDPISWDGTFKAPKAASSFVNWEKYFSVYVQNFYYYSQLEKHVKPCAKGYSDYDVFLENYRDSQVYTVGVKSDSKTLL
jgi:hypothetical protein